MGHYFHSVKTFLANIDAAYFMATLLYVIGAVTLYTVCRENGASKLWALCIAITWPVSFLAALLFIDYFH